MPNDPGLAGDTCIFMEAAAGDGGVHHANDPWWLSPDIELIGGITVRGRVTHAGTGKPVAGARVHYNPLYPNPAVGRTGGRTAPVRRADSRASSVPATRPSYLPLTRACLHLRAIRKLLRWLSRSGSSPPPS